MGEDFQRNEKWKRVPLTLRCNYIFTFFGGKFRVVRFRGRFEIERRFLKVVPIGQQTNLTSITKKADCVLLFTLGGVSRV